MIKQRGLILRTPRRALHIPWRVYRSSNYLGQRGYGGGIENGRRIATGKTLENVEFTAVRGLDGLKEAVIPVDGIGDVRVAVSHGLANARKILEKVKEGKVQYHFIEIMACPGGCVGGGGQPFPVNDEIRNLRAQALYQEDCALRYRKSHENPAIKKIYKEFLKVSWKIA
jgi:iron only hydrogenase large subunit-like protein